MQNYLGQIVPVAFPYAPPGWALCQGQLLQIAPNQALFSLLGTRFGGDGIQSFGLPNLARRVPVGLSGLPGDIGGTEVVPLIAEQLPMHRHDFNASQETAASGRVKLSAEGNIFGAGGGQPAVTLFDQAVGTEPLAPGNLSVAGSSRPHNNMQPYLVINYIIALTGIYPSRD